MSIQEFFNFQGNWSASKQYQKTPIYGAIPVGYPFISAPLVKDQDNMLALTGDTVPTVGMRPSLQIGTSWSVISTGVHISTSTPTSASDVTLGFVLGQIWLNTTNGDTYICTSNSAGAAVWKALAGDV